MSNCGIVEGGLRKRGSEREEDGKKVEGREGNARMNEEHFLLFPLLSSLRVSFAPWHSFPHPSITWPFSLFFPRFDIGLRSSNEQDSIALSLGFKIRNTSACCRCCPLFAIPFAHPTKLIVTHNIIQYYPIEFGD